MDTQNLKTPSIRPILILKSSIDPSISYNVVVTKHPHCYSIIADVGGKSQASPIHHLGHPNETNEKKTKKKQYWSGKLSRYVKTSRALNLKSAVSCILTKAKRVVQVRFGNSVLGVGLNGREMECVEPYFSVPVVHVMATH